MEMQWINEKLRGALAAARVMRFGIGSSASIDISVDFFLLFLIGSILLVRIR